jgi:hypothetical protein
VVEHSCVVCGARREFLSHGRVIDGSWRDDEFVDKRHWGKWVCSLKCYEELIEKGKSKRQEEVKR